MITVSNGTTAEAEGNSREGTECLKAAKMKESEREDKVSELGERCKLSVSQTLQEHDLEAFPSVGTEKLQASEVTKTTWAE